MIKEKIECFHDNKIEMKSRSRLMLNRKFDLLVIDFLLIPYPPVMLYYIHYWCSFYIYIYIFCSEVYIYQISQVANRHQFQTNQVFHFLLLFLTIKCRSTFSIKKKSFFTPIFFYRAFLSCYSIPQIRYQYK